MIKTIIIDDEPKGRLALQEKIKTYCPSVEIIGQAGDGEEAIALIEKLCPQLIFLDIEMPKLGGFEMLDRLNEISFYIIFTTAYDQYAIKAIKYAAFDYLLKPVDIEELKMAVHRVESARDNNEVKAQWQLLQESLRQTSKSLQKLAIPTQEGLLFLNIAHIIHLEASSNYTNIYMSDKSKITASKTLKDFQDILPGNIFFRTHHSHIINLHFIKKYIRGDGGQVELENGTMVEISRKNKESFLNRIGLYF